MEEIELDTHSTKESGGDSEAASETPANCSELSADVVDPEQDGGWDWLIVLSCFVLNYISVGYRTSFGIIFVELLDDFEATSSQVAWIQSIGESIILGMGLVSGALINTVGPRRTVIGGLLVSAVGVLASSFATRIWMLYFTFGVMTGAGDGISMFAGMILVSLYFKRRRSIATGVAVCGSSLGIITLPPILTVAIEKYGWRGSCFIMAAVMIQGIVFCAYIWKPRLNTMKKSLSDPSTKASDESSTDRELPKDSKEPREHEPRSRIRRALTSFLEEAVDIQLFKDPHFVCFCINFSLLVMCVIISFLYMPKRALTYGLDKTQAALVVSTVGFLSLFGRLAMGYIADLDRFRGRSIYLYASNSIVCGLAAALSFHQSFTAQIIYAVCFGIAHGGQAVLTPIVTADIVGVDKLTTGFGMANFIAIISLVLGPAGAGWIYDTTEKFEVVYGICGILYIISGLLIAIPQIVKHQKSG